jgi:hypothetical protein
MWGIAIASFASVLQNNSQPHSAKKIRAPVKTYVHSTMLIKLYHVVMVPMHGCMERNL